MLSDFKKKKFSYMFSIIDADGDGFITLDDYLRLPKRIAEIHHLDLDSMEYKQNYEYTLGNWKRIEACGDPADEGKVRLDGYLRFTEGMLGALEQLKAAGSANPLAKNFLKQLVLDSEGLVGPKEWAQFAWAWSLKDDPNAHFAKLDVEGHGRLSPEDIMRLYYQFTLGEDPSEPGTHFYGILDLN